MKKNISVLTPFEDEYKIKLNAVAANCVVAYGENEEALGNAHIVIGNPPLNLLAGMKCLEWLQLASSGTEPYSKRGVLKDGVILSNVTGAFGDAISEHMVAAVSMLYKKLHLYRDNQLRHSWSDMGEVKRIEGSVVVAAGLGDIGGGFAKRMKALGCYIIGIRRANTDKPGYADELYLSDKLDSVLPRADIVALALPNTAHTAGLFGRERIAKMKDGAVLLNVGRGSAVDTEALCDAAESGKLWGAALDVTDPEPLPEDHRMWNIKNILVTPHISGYFHMRKTYENIVGMCIDNVRRYLNGEELLYLVDPETGYRKL